jgi:hypothetical protein
MTPPTGPVTIVRDGQLIHGVWTAGTIRHADGSLLVANVQRSAEGTLWVRGHVTENDPTGRALLTVAALKPAVIDLSENSRRFIDNEISATEFHRNVDLWDEALARGEDVW